MPPLVLLDDPAPPPVLSRLPKNADANCSAALLNPPPFRFVGIRSLVGDVGPLKLPFPFRCPFPVPFIAASACPFVIELVPITVSKPSSQSSSFELCSS